MSTKSKEQIIESLNAIEHLPLEERKPEFARLFRESCDLCQSSPAEISHLTRINLEFVNGLYTGEHEGLPSEVFVRGFLKSISRQLKMPQEAFLTAYSRTLRNNVSDVGRKSEDLETKKIGFSKKSPEKKAEKKPLSLKSEKTENKAPDWTFGDQEVVKPLYLENHTLSQNGGMARSQASISPDELSPKNTPHAPATAVSAPKQILDFPPGETTGLRAKAVVDSNPSSSAKTGSAKVKGAVPSAIAVEPMKREVPRSSQESLKQQGSNQTATYSQATSPQTSRETTKAPGFAFSKVWAIGAGVAVVLAAALWPRERAPNGTVIEESLVSPKSETGDEAEPQILEAATSGGTETSSPENSALGDSSTASSQGPAATLNPTSGIPVVPVSPVVKGTLAIPEGKQVIEITAKEDVKVRVYIDGQTVDVNTLAPATHTYSFETNAEFFIYDAAAVDVNFNGRDLGSLGSKGKLRRLTFTKRLKDNKTLN